MTNDSKAQNQALANQLADSEVKAREATLALLSSVRDSFDILASQVAESDDLHRHVHRSLDMIAEFIKLPPLAERGSKG